MWKSPKPSDPDERRFWLARAALLDPLVYRWKADESQLDVND
jgi:hypothetical protein